MQNQTSNPIFRYAKYAFLVVALTALLLTTFSHEEAGDLNPVAERQALPDFASRDLAGAPWSISAQRGNVVLLNFWATWCPPCREETPGLVSLAHQYTGKNVRIAGVAMDEDQGASVEKFVRDYKIPYPILLPPADSPLAAGISSLPTTLLLDQQGRVAKIYNGAVDQRVFAADIDQLLNAPVEQSRLQAQ